MARLSIIMPVLDEGEGIAGALDALAELRALGVEVIVVDGGSHDATVQRARLRADQVLSAPRGRALQMNAGAAKASRRRAAVPARRHPACRARPSGWCSTGSPGRAAAGAASTSPSTGGIRCSRLVAAMMNLRSRLTGIATGDQAIFVKRDAFQAAGGFPEIPLMEDIALSKRLKRVSRPLCLRERATTSGRRWETHGVFRTILLMWRLRLAYFLGADPAALAGRYRYGGG